MKNKILAILKEIRPEYNFFESSNFVEDGILDSLDLITLVNELDREFSISIEGIDIIPKNFVNLEAIENLLKKSGAMNEF